MKPCWFGTRPTCSGSAGPTRARLAFIHIGTTSVEERSQGSVSQAEATRLRRNCWWKVLLTCLILMRGSGGISSCNAPLSGVHVLLGHRVMTKILQMDFYWTLLEYQCINLIYYVVVLHELSTLAFYLPIWKDHSSTFASLCSF